MTCLVYSPQEADILSPVITRLQFFHNLTAWVLSSIGSPSDGVLFRRYSCHSNGLNLLAVLCIETTYPHLICLWFFSFPLYDTVRFLCPVLLAHWFGLQYGSGPWEPRYVFWLDGEASPWIFSLRSCRLLHMAFLSASIVQALLQCLSWKRTSLRRKDPRKLLGQWQLESVATDWRLSYFQQWRRREDFRAS